MKEAINRPINIPGRRKVLTKNRILESQKHTKSNMEAARWLGVCYNTYSRWAKYYDVFDQHLNQKGVGIKKGFGKYRVDIESVVMGKRQPPKRWNHSVVKKMLIDKGYWTDECTICGYNEVNMKTNTCCLAIDFADGNEKNWLLENLRLTCANCYLSFNGWFFGSKRFCK
jgi:hypothetical protein